MSLARIHAATAGSVVLLGLSTGLMTGCPDPQKTYDAFGDRYTKINSSLSTTSGAGGGVCVAPAVGVIDGQWLFALSAKISPKKPVALLMDFSTRLDENNVLQLSMKETPLSYMDQKTVAGDQVDLGEFPIAADGSFTNVFPPLTVPGAANPITKDSPITASVTLIGEACADDPDFQCGEVTGKVTAPIMLDLADPPPVSTFTAQRVVGGVIPAPVINCAKDAAAY